MKSRLTLALFAVLVCSSNHGYTAPEKDQPANPSNDGFVSLFNGKDWDGWRLQIRSGDDELAHKVFTIEDGLVHVFKEVTEESKVGNKTNPTHGLIYTTKSYSRYIFRFDYKWGKNQANNFDKYQYDAGCYFHVHGDKIWPDGIEYQVRFDHLANKNHTGDIIGVNGKGVRWTADAEGNFLLPKDGGKAIEPPTKGWCNVLADAPFHGIDGEWNHSEIIVMGKEYAIFKLNGKIVNRVTDLPIADGIIGLQSETAEIFYRNIEIKEFRESIPIGKFVE